MIRRRNELTADLSYLTSFQVNKFPSQRSEVRGQRVLTEGTTERAAVFVEIIHPAAETQ